MATHHGSDRGNQHQFPPPRREGGQHDERQIQGDLPSRDRGLLEEAGVDDGKHGHKLIVAIRHAMDDHTIQGNRLINTTRRCKVVSRMKRDKGKASKNRQHNIDTMEAYRKQAFLHYTDRVPPSPATIDDNLVEEFRIGARSNSGKCTTPSTISMLRTPCVLLDSKD